MGGATRAMIATAKYSSKLGNFEHRAISQRTAVPQAAEMAKEAGMVVIEPPDEASMLQEIENADIVHIHYWNYPQMSEFLRFDLPPMRLLMWFHIAGEYPPQVITKQLVGYADFAIPCNPYSYELPVFQNLPAEVRIKKIGMVYDAAEFERVADLQPKPHDTFNVGYIGSVGFGKMHRNYVAMSAAAKVPNVRFIVCGGGMENYLKQEAMQLGAAEKFDFRGFVEDIKSVIEVLDIYGYPLCEDTYAAAELNLQEVMYAGIPPVVFPYGGIRRLVIDNYTGLIVRSELEYAQAIEYLYHHPEERARLGSNAREYAKQIFGAENAAKQLNPIYERMMQLPKQTRKWGVSLGESLLAQPVTLEDLTGEPESLSGSKLFVESLGNTAPEFLVSMTSSDTEELLVAAAKIAEASILVKIGEGGLSQYRSFYDNDGYLRFWSGLILQRQGQYAEAISEFASAIELGCDRWLVFWYLAQVAVKINDFNLAKEALEEVLATVPDFAPAQAIAKDLALQVNQEDLGEMVNNLRLRDINLIVFPDWSQSEESVASELARVIRAIATHPQANQITLLVDTKNITEEDANLAVSGVVMNLLMEEELDVSDGAEISFTGELNSREWSALLPRLQARIALQCDNEGAIAAAQAENLPTYTPDKLP